MRRKLLFAVLVGLIVAPPAAARPVQLMPGVTYERILQWTPAGPLALYVITAPRPGGLYSLTPLLSNGTIVGRETVSSMERDVSAQMTTIGVNGDFFSWHGGWPSGLLIRGGVVEHQTVPGRAAVGIDTSGTLHVDRVPWYGRWHGADNLWQPISQLNEPPRADSTALFTPVWGANTPASARSVSVVLGGFPPLTPRHDLAGVVQSVLTKTSVAVPPDGAVLVARGAAAQPLQSEAVVGAPLTVRIPLLDNWATVTDAVSAGPTLVKDGRPIYNAGEALTKVQLRGRDPRTAVGQRADGGIVMLAADGRQPGWSAGISNWQLALTLIRYGCVTGFALDSGGSTTVAFDGQVLNRPSDPGGERPVGEALVIAYTGILATASATLSPNNDGVDDRESLSYKLVRPATVNAKVIGPTGSAIELDAGQRPAGRQTFVWNGLDAAGVPLPEGRYHWNVTATDDLGRTSTDDRTFTLDNTLGFLQLSSGARRIGFNLARAASVRVTIETVSGDILRTVAAGPRAAGQAVVLWNGRDGRGKRLRRGTYVVRVAASSPVGLSVLERTLRIAG